MRRILPLFCLGAMACASTPNPPDTHAHHSKGQHGGDGQGHHEKGQGHDKHMKHSFEDPEFWAKRFDAPERAAWQKPADLVALLALKPGMRVADIGAGTGYFLPYLSPAVGPEGQVYALDIEAKLVAYMEARATKAGLSNVQVKQVDPTDPQLEDSAMDRVMIVDTWHHIADRTAYARKVLAGLKRGGSFYVVDFTQDSPTGPPVEFRILAKTVVTTLKVAGFEAEILQEGLPRQYVVRGLRPLAD